MLVIISERDLVFFVLLGGRFGCSSTTALGPALWWTSWCGGVRPLCFSFNTGSLLRCRYTQECGCGWKLRVCLVSSVVLWVVAGCVDVPIQSASVFSWAVTRVEVPIQPGEFIFVFFPYLWSSRIIILYCLLYQWKTHCLVRFVKNIWTRSGVFSGAYVLWSKYIGKIASQSVTTICVILETISTCGRSRRQKKHILGHLSLSTSHFGVFRGLLWWSYFLFTPLVGLNKYLISWETQPNRLY
jgi:hypothetical protein